MDSRAWNRRAGANKDSAAYSLTWYYALNIIIVTWRKLFESNKLAVRNKHCVEVGIEGNFKLVGICIWYMRIKKEKKKKVKLWLQLDLFRLLFAVSHQNVGYYGPSQYFNLY